MTKERNPEWADQIDLVRHGLQATIKAPEAELRPFATLMLRGLAQNALLMLNHMESMQAEIDELKKRPG